MGGFGLHGLVKRAEWLKKETWDDLQVDPRGLMTSEE